MSAKVWQKEDGFGAVPQGPAICSFVCLFCSLFFKVLSLAWSSSGWLAWLAGEARALLSVSPNTWITGQSYYDQLSLHGFWVLGAQTKVLELGRQALYWPTCLPRPWPYRFFLMCVKLFFLVGKRTLEFCQPLPNCSVHSFLCLYPGHQKIMMAGLSPPWGFQRMLEVLKTVLFLSSDEHCTGKNLQKSLADIFPPVHS